MGELTFITGGARSGKSHFAEKLLSRKDRVLYIATATPFDEEMAMRIKIHRKKRNPQWETFEGYKNIAASIKPLLKGKEAVMLDCLTLLISNLMFDDGDMEWDTASQARVARCEDMIARQLDDLLKTFSGFPGQVLIVSNELGMGLVPEHPLGRYFRDIAGRMNQKTASAAQKVYLLVSGIPVCIKGAL